MKYLGYAHIVSATCRIRHQGPLLQITCVIDAELLVITSRTVPSDRLVIQPSLAINNPPISIYVI